MKPLTLITLVSALFVGSACAGTIAVDPISGQTGYSSGFGGLTLGWEFQVTASEGITVDSLGFWDYQSDGFLFSQTFPVGIWEASSGTLLRSTTITSSSALRTSLHSDGDWRFNAISPVYLPPGTYRIGYLDPPSGANAEVDWQATVQAASGITLTRHMRQIGNTNLTMPDLNMNDPDDANFGPTFTFVPGPPGPTGATVAPSAYNNTPGPTGVNTLVRNSGQGRSYQMQFSANALSGLPIGAKITELRFRLDINATVAFPVAATTWSDYFVILSQAFNPVSSMSATFSANMKSPVIVKTGTLSISAGTFTTGASPNATGPLIVFDTPYVYQGGDLVMMFRHNGSDSATNTAFLDGLNSATPGYGTDFRALSTNSFTANIGLPASVTMPQIVFTYVPRQTISQQGTNVIIVGSGGPPRSPFHLMASTNLAAPIAQWTSALSNLFDSGGSFRFTNQVPTNLPARFFRISLP
jgi:hypothetical protein